MAALWGEDLVEYLDEIYRMKARYAIIFVSRFYSEKMWTRHERRSALARGLEQASAYVLPVRLDSTALAGMRPTVGYLDARQLGLDGIVGAALTKLTGAPRVKASAITHVPRTEAERQQVLLERPPGWEFLYFAGQLLHERDAVEGKYRDHEIRYAAPTGMLVREDGIPDYMSTAVDDVRRLIETLNLVINPAVQERAFGAPGQSGDADRIAHMAKRWNGIYEEFMDWAARLRGVSAPSKFHELLELLARYADGSVQNYREFVNDFVAQIDRLPSAIAAKEPVQIEMAIVVEVGDEVSEAYHAEFDRVFQDRL
jgi:hypothetical protein